MAMAMACSNDSTRRIKSHSVYFRSLSSSTLVFFLTRADNFLTMKNFFNEIPPFGCFSHRSLLLYIAYFYVSSTVAVVLSLGFSTGPPPLPLPQPGYSSNSRVAFPLILLTVRSFYCLIVCDGVTETLSVVRTRCFYYSLQR